MRENAVTAPACSRSTRIETLLIRVQASEVAMAPSTATVAERMELANRLSIGEHCCRIF